MKNACKIGKNFVLLKPNGEVILAAKRRRKLATRIKDYFRSSQTLAFGLIAVLPLLLGYEYLALRASQEHVLEVRNGADVILRTLLKGIGLHSPFYLGIGLVVALGLAIGFRRRGTHLQVSHFFLALFESVLYAVALTYALTGTIEQFMLSATVQRAFHSELMLALGAGVYEEVFFRLLLFGSSVYALRHITSFHPVMLTLSCAVFSSVLFSLAHYMGFESFTVYSFIYRFLAGMIFCLIYYYRGFGIAAWTHAIYDIVLIL